MNIYHIKFTGHDYDEYDSFIVIARDKEDALELIKSSIPYGESVDNIICIGVSKETEARFVLGSFNAG